MDSVDLGGLKDHDIYFPPGTPCWEGFKKIESEMSRGNHSTVHAYAR